VIVIVSVAAAACAGALALVVARLAGTFEQLQTAARVQPAQVRGEAVARAAEVGDVAAPAASATPPTESSTEAYRPAASGGDEHILKMLAADPEFARGATELLNDPDPQARDEARLLLRELGVERRSSVLEEAAREADTWLPTTASYWFESLRWRERLSNAARRQPRPLRRRYRRRHRP
jgi:hypothetical protein